MKSFAIALAATAGLVLAACQPAEPSPAAEADLARGEASTGAAGAVTGTTDPNPRGVGATTGAETSQSAADLKSTSPLAPNPGSTPHAAEPAPQP